MKQFEILTPENAVRVHGGKADTIVVLCATAEVKQCLTVEGKYCGPAKAIGPVEIQGPVNPWG